MSKQIIFTENAPNPVGPYSQAVLVKDTLYVSGQIALEATTGDMVNGSIPEETKQVMDNLKAVLFAADMTFHQVVKCTIYVTDMASFAVVNEVYAQYFVDSPPARETVEVSALPKGARVGISCIAMK